MGKKAPIDKTTLFRDTPVPKALYAMAVPTIISQLVNLVHNMVDAFFIGRTGNAYMMAATSITLTLVLMNVALANLFGTGGGSLMARLMGAGRPDRGKKVSAYSVYGAVLAALVYSALVGIFNRTLLRFLGASDATFGYARSYAMVVIVLGSLPSILSMTLFACRATAIEGSTTSARPAQTFSITDLRCGKCVHPRTMRSAPAFRSGSTFARTILSMRAHSVRLSPSTGAPRSRSTSATNSSATAAITVTFLANRAFVSL